MGRCKMLMSIGAEVIHLISFLCSSIIIHPELALSSGEC